MLTAAFPRASGAAPLHAATTRHGWSLNIVSGAAEYSSPSLLAHDPEYTHVGERGPQMGKLAVSMAALLVAEACNVGRTPVTDPAAGQRPAGRRAGLDRRRAVSVKILLQP